MDEFSHQDVRTFEIRYSFTIWGNNDAKDEVRDILNYLKEGEKLFCAKVNGVPGMNLFVVKDAFEAMRYAQKRWGRFDQYDWGRDGNANLGEQGAVAEVTRFRLDKNGDPQVYLVFSTYISDHGVYLDEEDLVPYPSY